MEDPDYSKFIQIDGQIYTSEQGKSVLIFEDVNQANFYQLENLKEIQNQMAQEEQNKGYILEIENLKYYKKQKIMEVWLKNKDYLKYIHNARALDEYLKYELFNQACVLINILVLNQNKKTLPELTKNNVFFNSEKLMISFLTDKFVYNKQNSCYNVIIEIMIQIIENKSCSLHLDILSFYQQQIQKLIDKKNISEFLLEYSYNYEILRMKYNNMPILPKQLQQLIPKQDFIYTGRSSFSTNPSISNLEQIPLQKIQLQNKFIQQKEYQDQAEYYKMEIKRNKKAIQKVEENYYYYFDLEFLKSLKKIHNDIYSEENIKQKSIIEKIQILIDLQDQCYQMEIDNNNQIPKLVELNHTYQYYVLKHMEEYYIQQNDNLQLINFRFKYSQIIDKLNKIDAEKFEFNQISKNFDLYVHRQRVQILKWFLMGENNILNKFINYQYLKDDQVIMPTRENIIQDYNKNEKWPAFKQIYLTDIEDFQVGYAVDHLDNYYKGVFQNQQLIIGNILQVYQNNKILEFKNVSCKNNQIFGQNCKKIIYIFNIQPEVLEQYKGEIKNGQYFGEGTLIKYKGGQECKTYIGNFQNGLLEGRGKLLKKDGDRYEGNFKQGELDDGTFIKKNYDKQEIWKVQKGKKIKQKSSISILQKIKEDFKKNIQ